MRAIVPVAALLLLVLGFSWKSSAALQDPAGDDGRRWEYRVEFIAMNGVLGHEITRERTTWSAEAAAEFLNARAAEGWEVVTAGAADTGGGKPFMVYRRPKASE